MYDIEKAIRKRRSVRTYDKRKVDLCAREEMMAYAEALQNPLGPKITFKLLDKEADPKGEKLGTYGIIKGSELYVGAKVKRHEYAFEALGYDFEKLVLYLTDKGLGTCWLGGTFNKGAFAEAMEVDEDEIFTIVSPIGYEAEKMSLIEVMMRRGSKGDSRMEWDKLFFDGDFDKALTEETAGEYALPLEMVRLAPSAVNRQPWRIVMKDGEFHFYQSGIKPEDPESVNMHRIDMGIAVCHFHVMAEKLGLQGRFVRNIPDIKSVPDNTRYIISWIAE